MRKNNQELHNQTQTQSAKARDAKKHFEEDSNAILTQEELARWWPFKRLAPHRFPKPVEPTYPEAVL
jgi:hypothetical protein